MLEALIVGERDPRVLGLARGRMCSKDAALVQAPTGRSMRTTPEFTRILLDQIDALTAQIDTLTDQARKARNTSRQLQALIVLLPGDALPLAFLGGKSVGAASPPFGLETVQHVVEGSDEVRDVPVAGHGQALSRAEQIDPFHQLGQSVQWSQGRAEQHGVHGEHHRPDPMVSTPTSVRDTGIDTVASDSTSTRGTDDEHQRVESEQPPEQRRHRVRLARCRSRPGARRTGARLGMLSASPSPGPLSMVAGPHFGPAERPHRDRTMGARADGSRTHPPPENMVGARWSEGQAHRRPGHFMLALSPLVVRPWHQPVQTVGRQGDGCCTR
jgi:hypothetical protein